MVLDNIKMAQYLLLLIRWWYNSQVKIVTPAVTDSVSVECCNNLFFHFVTGSVFQHSLIINKSTIVYILIKTIFIKQFLRFIITHIHHYYFDVRVQIIYTTNSLGKTKY